MTPQDLQQILLAIGVSMTLIGFWAWGVQSLSNYRIQLRDTGDIKRRWGIHRRFGSWGGNIYMGYLFLAVRDKRQDSKYVVPQDKDWVSLGFGRAMRRVTLRERAITEAFDAKGVPRPCVSYDVDTNEWTVTDGIIEYDRFTSRKEAHNLIAWMQKNLEMLPDVQTR